MWHLQQSRPRAIPLPQRWPSRCSFAATPSSTTRKSVICFLLSPCLPFKDIYTADPWATSGIGSRTHQGHQNPQMFRSHSWLCLWLCIHEFNEPQFMQCCSIYWKKKSVSGPMQLKLYYPRVNCMCCAVLSQVP